MGTFPFGSPVRECRPIASGHRSLFVLGAYPSALHVRWDPPPGSALRTVKALAVDNEPEPFWAGAGQIALIDAWRQARRWQHDWGSIAPVLCLNGSSGEKFERRILAPLHIDRGDTWITDCLDTYRMSNGMRNAIAVVYNPFSVAHNLPRADLVVHPSESAIVREAVELHLPRLRKELALASPKRVVTLGNAALRLFRALLDSPAGPKKLSADESYGDEFDVETHGATLRWLPLAHPAAPEPYQRRHDVWMDGWSP